MKSEWPYGTVVRSHGGHTAMVVYDNGNGQIEMTTIGGYEDAPEKGLLSMYNRGKTWPWTMGRKTWTVIDDEAED